MSFTTLPTNLQDIYIVNLELALKVVFVILLTYWCYSKLKQLKDIVKTPYILLAQWRVIQRIVLGGTFYLMPFISLFIFYPTFPFSIIQIVTMWFYLVAMVVLFTIFLINVLYWGTTIVVHYGGFDSNAEKTNEVLNDLSRMWGKLRDKQKSIFIREG